MNGGRVWGTTFVLVKHGEEKEQNFRQFFFAHHMGTDHNGILHHAKIAEKQKGKFFFFLLDMRLAFLICFVSNVKHWQLHKTNDTQHFEKIKDKQTKIHLNSFLFSLEK